MRTLPVIEQRPHHPDEPEVAEVAADVYIGHGTSPVNLILHLRHAGCDLRIVLDPLAAKLLEELHRLPACREAGRR